MAENTLNVSEEFIGLSPPRCRGKVLACCGAAVTYPGKEIEGKPTSGLARLVALFEEFRRLTSNKGLPEDIVSIAARKSPRRSRSCN